MNFVKKFFPFSFGTADVKSLVIRALIYYFAPSVLAAIVGGGYIVGAAIAGLLESSLLLALFALVEMVLMGVIGLLGIYCTAGLVFLFLAHFKVIK